MIIQVAGEEVNYNSGRVSQVSVDILTLIFSCDCESLLDSIVTAMNSRLLSPEKEQAF